MAKEAFPGEAEFLLHMGDHDEKWLRQPVTRIALRDIPEWASRNRVEVTADMVACVTRRCLEEYGELYESACPSSDMCYAANDYREYLRETGTSEDELPDEYTEEDWKQAESEFFEVVAALDKFKFTDNGCRGGYGVRPDSLLGYEFSMQVPSYREWSLDRTMKEVGKVLKEHGRLGADVMLGGLAGLDLSKAGKSAVPAPAKSAAKAPPRPPARRGRDASVRGYDEDYDIPDEYEEMRRRSRGDIGDE